MAGGLKKKLFQAALVAKSEGLKRGQLTHGLYDRLLFNKIKKALGMDHLRIMISGSAPLSENVMTFFRCMLGVPVVEGMYSCLGRILLSQGRFHIHCCVGLAFCFCFCFIGT